MSISKRMIGLLLSFQLLFCSVSMISASADEHSINIKVFICPTDLYYLNSNIPTTSCVYGTYGVPASYNTRLVNCMNYVKGYYGYHSVNVNYQFTTSQIVNTPASISTNAASNKYNRIIGGCFDCNHSCSECSSTTHHSDDKAFIDSIPSFNTSNEVAMIVSASRMYSFDGSYHLPITGMNCAPKVVIQDHDYVDAGNAEYESYHRPYMNERMEMVHEIGHFYGISDHYDSLANVNCIWGKNRHSCVVKSNCMTCSSCSQSIYANRNIYQHTPYA